MQVNGQVRNKWSQKQDINYIITYLTINSNKFTLNKKEYGFSNAGHIKMVCQIQGFNLRDGQYGRIGTRSNSRADVNDCSQTNNNLTKKEI